MLFSLPYSADCIFVPFVCNLFSWNTTPAEGEPASTHSLYLHWLAASSVLILWPHSYFLAQIWTRTRYVRLRSWLEQLNKLMTKFSSIASWWTAGYCRKQCHQTAYSLRLSEIGSQHFDICKSLQGWPLTKQLKKSIEALVDSPI